MNKIWIWLLALAVVCGSAGTADAQKRKKKSTKKRVAAAPKKVEVVEQTTTEQVTAAPPAPKYVFKYISVDSLDYDASGYNSLSVVPVHTSDVMYRMKITRRIPLKEKCNTPFFNSTNEITTHLINGILTGKLTPYQPDSLNKILPLNFVEQYLTKVDPFDGSISRMKGRDIDFIDITEDLIFDRQRSVTVYDIHYITLTSPADESAGRPLAIKFASLRYKECEKFFDALPVNAKWRNPINNKENRTFSEAFRLRLFCGIITQISKDNPEDRSISEYVENAGNQEASLLAAQRIEYELIDWENELYEY